MDHFKFVVTEEYKIVNGGNWPKKQFLNISGCEGTDARNRKRQFSHRKTVCIWIFCDANSDRRDKACGSGEIQVRITRKISTKMFSLESSN